MIVQGAAELASIVRSGVYFTDKQKGLDKPALNLQIKFRDNFSKGVFFGRTIRLLLSWTAII